jgi:VanZ family protein
MSIFGSKKNEALALAWAWTILTAVALLVPGRADDDMGRWLPAVLEPFADKLVHAGLFFVLVVLISRAVNGESDGQESGGQKKKGRAGLGATLLSVGLFVILLEIGQFWVPNRTFETFDIVAGLVGALVATVLIVVKYR